MAKWFFEPGHTAAEFCARHMMVTCVRGHFKDVHGTLDFDPENPSATSVAVTIDARGLWTGEPARDDHLRSADFLDVENYPTITFRGKGVELVGANEGKLGGELTIRGVTRPVTLDVPLDSPRQAIEAVEKSANVKAVFEGQKMVFQDANAAASKPAPASKKKKK